MTANTVAAKGIRTVLLAMLTGIGFGIGFLIIDKALTKEQVSIQQAPAAGYSRGGRGRSEEDLTST